ncbi:MAG TPA: S9 family peptidase [Ktedonobacterales bacterium]|nr:S9 family peptidase [Ktedonobacterales bacterium]
MTTPESTPRMLTLDDIFAFDHVIDAQISPDGALVAYTVTRDYSEGDAHTPAASVWMANADGPASAARRFTYGPHGDSQPRWSPDGRWLAFLSDREKLDTPQVYVAPVAGGEARRLTDAKGGVASLAWSPDGKQIAYLAPDADTEEEERRKKDKDDAIHEDHEYKFTRLWAIAVDAGQDGAQPPARAITLPEYQVQLFAWFEDGWAIATSQTPKEDDVSFPWPLRIVREGDAAITLWEGDYAIMALSATPSGDALAWRHGGASAEKNADEVWVLRSGSQPRRVLSEYPGDLTWVGWQPDGAALYITAFTSTRATLSRLALHDGDSSAEGASEATPETLLANRAFYRGGMAEPWLSVSRDGRRIACALEDGAHPGEIWVGEPGGALHSVTSHNHHLQAVALGRQETIQWEAPDGLTIEGVLVYPVGYEEGRRYPLIVQAHGGPNGMWMDKFLMSWHDWAQWLAAHGYVVLAPNPRGSLGHGPTSTWSNQRRWGVGDFADFISGVDALVARGLADPDRLGIGGWSYGGYMTSWAIGHSDRFKAAVMGAGVTDLFSFISADIPSWLPREQMFATMYEDPDIYLRLSPISAVGAITTPTLIVHGAADERVRLGQGRELYHALRARHIPTEMVVYPREPHIFGEKLHQRDLLRRVADWFDRWLQPDAPHTSGE